MADDRRGPWLTGALAAMTGGLLFLAAGDVISLPDRMFGAPRAIVAVFALGFFLGGAYVAAVALPTPRMRQLLGGAAGLTLLTAGALLMTWVALTAGGERAPAPVRPDSLVLGPEAGRLITRAFFWLFAIPIDAAALVAWALALRSLFIRSRPGSASAARSRT